MRMSGTGCNVPEHRLTPEAREPFFSFARIAPPTKTKKNVRCSGFMFRVPPKFFGRFCHMLMYIGTADAPHTHNRLQRTDEETSRCSSRRPARSLVCLVCLRVKRAPVLSAQLFSAWEAIFATECATLRSPPIWLKFGDRSDM